MNRKLQFSTETVTSEITEEERQMILFALAYLSVDRPGWDQALNGIACKLDNTEKGRSVFYDQIRKFQPLSVRQLPKPDVLGRASGSMYEQILTHLAEDDGAGAAEAVGAAEAAGGAAESAGAAEAEATGVAASGV